jgi:hypothetical protein
LVRWLRTDFGLFLPRPYSFRVQFGGTARDKD